MAAFLDNCKFTPTAGGTTDWTYSAAVTGYQSPAAAGVVNGEKYKYLAISADLTQWEIGEGAYNTSTGVLPRTTVLYNSSGTGIAAGQSGAGSKISFTLVPNVAVVGVKEDLLAFDEANFFNATQKNQAQKNLSIPALLQGYIAGLTLSTAGSSTTFSVSSGCATDTTNADILSLTSSISKTTSAWMAGTGNGGLDIGTIAASTWYHAHIIKNVSAQTVDVLVSLSGSSPTLPSGYTLARRVGSMKTNSSSQWTGFVQNGNEFLWTSAVGDVNTTTLGTTATLFTLSVPTGVQVRARMRGLSNSTAAGLSLLINSPDEASVAVDTPTGNRTAQNPTASSASGGIFTIDVRTNTSGQIRAVAASANTSLTIATYGWLDPLGGIPNTTSISPATSNSLAPFMRSYLAGLTLSTAGSSTTFSVAAGTAADSTNADLMTLSASISKTTSSWISGSGNGGLDTGTIAASTWYHAHLIKNESSGAVEFLVSLSASAPTLPSGFTLFRRVGSMKTNASSQWTAFSQNGDEFLLSVPVQDIALAATLGATAATETLASVPTGVEVWAIGMADLQIGSGSCAVLLSSLDTTDTAPAVNGIGYTLVAGDTAGGGLITIRTNTSAQFRARSTVASTFIGFTTIGWRDRRGKDA